MAALKIPRSVLYRAAQFFAALKAYLPLWAGGGLTTADQAMIAVILTSLAQRRLFSRMSPNDQRHAMAVADTLRRAGYDQPALLQAALLHDVAKSLGQPIIYRVLIVLLKAFWPSALHRLGEPASQPSACPYWRRPFVIHIHHPAIGAGWAEEVGCDPLAVKLMARHQDILSSAPLTEEEKLLAILQWADNLN